MKKIVLKISSDPDASLTVTSEICKHFYDQFHYHPEFELTLIQRGEGTRFIGNNIERFGAGDLVLVGSKLPHVWKCDPMYYEKHPDRWVSSIVLHFSEKFLDRDFLNTLELIPVKASLEKAGNGLSLNGSLKQYVAESMVKMLNADSFSRLVILLEILHKIGTSPEVNTISSESTINAFELRDFDRLSKVHEYINLNFKHKVTLSETAKVANMSMNAFSRYFRRRTRKRFSQFLKEVRVAHACHLLLERNMKISTVCFESGFSNVSNFNVQFKSVMKRTPKEFIEAMKKTKAINV